MKNVITSHIELGINENWAMKNLELFGKAIAEFLVDHPPTEWTITITDAYMPGETWSVIAKRKET